MPKELPEYAGLVRAIEPLLVGWTGKLIAIDGRPLGGKSTLARFLAWQLGVPAIHTDLFMKEGQGRSDYRYEELERAIQSRLGKRSPAPVIVEGVAVLRLLQRLDLQPDFLVHVASSEQAKRAEQEEFDADLDAYEEEFSPKSRADCILELNPPSL